MTLCAIVSFALALCLCSSALAARGHVFGEEFAGPGSGAGQLSGPSDVAVNESTGDVYVTDEGNDRVEYFTAAGGFVGEFDGSGTHGEGVAAGGGGLAGEVATGRFVEPEEIAVDNTCPQHEAETGLALSLEACDALDPSNGDVYVADVGHEVVDKYSATGVYIGQIAASPAGGFGLGLLGVAVDVHGDVWVSENHQVSGARVQSIDRFDDAAHNVYVSQTVPPNVEGFTEPGVAVDSEEDLYLHVSKFFPGTNVIRKFASDDGRLLSGALNTEPPSGVAVEPSTDDVYIDDVESITRYSSKGSLLERFDAPGMHGSGVAVNDATGQVYAVDTQSGVVDEFPPEPPGAPRIETESVLKVSADDASAEVEVNPHGAATEAFVEYGICADAGNCAASSYEGKDAITGIPSTADFDAHSATFALTGLHPETTYHLRVTAENTVAGKTNVTEGLELNFTTRVGTTGGLVLPDHRGWELVSPPEKRGGLIQPIAEQGVVEASENGDAISYLSNIPSEANPLGFSNSVQIISVRGPGGWSSRDLTTPHVVATGKSIGYGQEFRAFSEDLSLSVLQPFGSFVALSGAASEQTPYLRSDRVAGAEDTICTEGCYRPLVTGCPSGGEECSSEIEAMADVPAGTAFGGEREGKCVEANEPIICGPKFRGATPDMSHVLFESGADLTPGTKGGLYEWAGGVLGFIGSSIKNGFQTVSTDGQKVVFNGTAGGKEGLFMGEVGRTQPVQIDADQAGCAKCSQSGRGVFQAASTDGARVFFTDDIPLTEASGGSLNASSDLYECETPAEPSGGSCQLSDLTPLGPGEEQAGVLGIVGASEDGSWIYFAANGALAAGAVHNGSCSSTDFEPAPAECNLYALHYDGQNWEAPRFLGVLAGEDYPDWSGHRSLHVARASDSGEWLAFMSQRSLTDYDNRDAVSGSPDEEVYLYHAAGIGELKCASCQPTNARPEGKAYGALNGGLVGGNRVWESGQSLAANIPGWTPYELGASVYDSRFLSDSGRLFFNSSDDLVPQDTNEAEDVYEYERPGEGDCSTESQTFSERSGGCVGLVSSGRSGEESGFVDASKSGDDVFFLTTEKLAGQDIDSSLDMYDAHVCTPASPCVGAPASAPPACSSEESCRPAGTQQPPASFGPPATATFSGPLNSKTLTTITPPKGATKPLTRKQKLAKALKACKKVSKRKRASCEKKARRSFGPIRKPKSKKKSTGRHG